MQIGRLFEIVYILLDKKTATAAELAEHFGVSVRTIYRDVETLSAAKIPIYAEKGRGGGIRLLDHFVMNKSILSENEQREVLAALQGLRATHFSDIDPVLDKLSTLFHQKLAPWVELDFSDWSRSDRDTFERIKRAVFEKRLLTFDYYSAAGEKTERVVEPNTLWFKHRNWYLKAFCRGKNDERLFKISRTRNLQILDEYFQPHPAEENPYTPPDRGEKTIVTLKLKIEASQRYRILDEFEDEQVEQLESGDFLVTVTYPEDEWVYGFILSFGHFAEVLEPEHIRHILRERLQKNLEKYLLR